MDRKEELREITFGRKRRTPSPLQNLRFGPILVVGLGREREGLGLGEKERKRGRGRRRRWGEGPRARRIKSGTSASLRGARPPLAPRCEALASVLRARDRAVGGC